MPVGKAKVGPVTVASTEMVPEFVTLVRGSDEPSMPTPLAELTAPAVPVAIAEMVPEFVTLAVVERY